MCCPLVFEFSVGIGGFVIGLGQISFFFSLYLTMTLTMISQLKIAILNFVTAMDALALHYVLICF